MAAAPPRRKRRRRQERKKKKKKKSDGEAPQRETGTTRVGGRRSSPQQVATPPPTPDAADDRGGAATPADGGGRRRPRPRPARRGGATLAIVEPVWGRAGGRPPREGGCRGCQGRRLWGGGRKPARAASAGVAAGAQAAPRWRGGRCVCRPVTRPYGAWWRGHRHPHARRAAVAGVPERRGRRAGRQQRWGRSCATAAGRPAGQACSACTSPPTGRPPRSAYGSSSLSRGTTFMPCSSWKRSLHAYGICSADTAAPVRQYWHQPL